MCGFFFNTSQGDNYSTIVNNEKFNRLKHRGVDNSTFKEFETNKKIFMGHHRLAINDLDKRANQPLKSDCNNYCILFNGEIFNFNRLKKEIDYNFITKTDTEVILAGYKNFGKDFLKKLEGFFSIAILDLKRNNLLITVDPTSSKSIYYQNLNNSITVASELNCFFPINKNEIINNISQQSLELYLQYGYIHAPYSILKNVYKLQPGELIEFNLDNHEVNKFKKFNQHHEVKNKKRIDELIIEAHQSRLVSDVPIAKMLSSGVDSTLSNYIYKKIFNNTEEVYTLGIRNSDLDESELSIEQTKKLRLNHKVFKVDEIEIIKELKNLSKYLDEPFADSSSILVSLLSKEISKKYKVAISSDGGDELLFGYSRHKFFYFFSWLCYLPKSIKSLIKKFIISRYFQIFLSLFLIKHQEIKINKIFSFLDQSNSIKSYLGLIKLIPDSITQKIKKNYKEDSLMKNFETHYNYRSIKEIDYNFYLPSINFKNDRCGMHYSLEIREPMLNFNLIRHFFKKQITILDIIYPKKIFRNFLKKNKIIISKKKHGFSFSQRNILEYNNYEILEYFEKNISILADFFDINFINTMIIDFKNKRKWTTEIWIILTFTLWIKNKVQ